MRVLHRLSLSLAMVLVAGSANAASLVSVTAAPDPAAPNQQVTITATKSGTQNCGWKVIYGDGGSSAPMGFPDPTKNALHTYTANGTYTIQVTGASHGNKPNCTGSASTQIVVETSNGGGGGTVQIGPAVDRPVLKPKGDPGPEFGLTELCQKVDCGALTYLPKVEGHFGFTKPGGVVAFKGRGFGSAGKMTLTYKDWKNATKTADLEILEWTTGMVGTKIPASLQGFQDQTASVVLTNSLGKKSPAYAFALHPTLDSVDLSRNDVRIVHCDDDANLNACDMLDNPGDPPIPGFHMNKIGAIGDDQGTDKYEIKVKNGWVISWTRTDKWGTSSNEWVNGPSNGAGVGLATWTPSYTWNVSPADKVWYSTWITVEGPRGVPFK